MILSKIFSCAFAVIFTSIFFSCNKKPEVAEHSSNNLIDNSLSSHELVPTKNLIFDIDQETSLNNFFYDVFRINDREYMGLVNRNNNSLQVYSIPEGKLYAKIKLDNEGPEAFPKLRAFTVINPDSILVINLYGKNLWMVDIKGNVKKKFNIRNKDKPLFSLSIGFYTGSKPLFLTSKLYIESQSKDIDNFKLPHFEPDNLQEIEIDLVNESWKFVNVSYPPVYQGNLWRYNISRDIGRNGNIIYSFAVDPNVQEYNRNNWIATPYLAKSKFVENIRPLPKLDEEEVAKYFLETPQYSNLAYDKYRDVYYRFVRHGLDRINPNTGELNTPDEASFSIIILDGDLNKIGETKVDDFKYQMNAYFVTKEGLYICNSHPKNPELIEDQIVFTMFKLDSIKSAL